MTREDVILMSTSNRGIFCIFVLTVASTLLPVRADNLLRNGSFEFDNRFNGMKTLMGSKGDFLAFMWSHLKLRWCNVGLEQWWGDGVTNAALFSASSEAHSGVRSLKVSAPGTATTWLVYVDDWPSDGAEAVTLSWWTKGKGTGRAEVFFCEGKAGFGAEKRLANVASNLRVKGTGWTKGSCVLEIPPQHRVPGMPAFEVKFAVSSGELLFDDVQLEYGRAATDFSERSDHFLSLSAAGVDEAELPTFTAGKGGKAGLVVRNTSGRTISGVLTVYVDEWKKAGTTKVFETRCSAWKSGAKKKVPVDLGSFGPGAFVAVAELNPLVSKEGVYCPTNTGWGNVGRTQLLKRNGMRFAVFPDVAPGRLFGVGNGGVGGGGYWAGRTMENAELAKSIHPVLLGPGDPYKAALIGAPRVEDVNLYNVGTNKSPGACNPARPNMVNAFSPNGRKIIAERARSVAKSAADDPSVAAYKIANESAVIYNGSFCPDKWADLDFRKWVRRRHAGNLKRLNTVWHTSFASWEDVVQPISGMKDGTVEKTGAAALDWNASFGKMTDAAKARLRARPAMAMDWYRWRRDSTLRLWDDFLRVAHAHDKKTLYANNYCWPNFSPHCIWPQWRTHDLIMLDLQYVCGFPKTLGTNEEMIDILEQAESISRGERPIWGREVYVQPRYPGEMAALQNWAMIAHGMSVPMTFGWTPYADDQKWKFKEKGPKSWLLKDAPPMWFIIDIDGSKTDCYGPNARSTEEIAQYHRKYDGHSINRIRGDVALYYSTEESMYIHFETFDSAYASRAAQCRTAVAAALRYAGARIEYFDDATLAEVDPKSFPVMVAPGERMVSAKAEALLRRYVEKGGVLVAFNDFNTLDVNVEPKKSPGAAGWKGRVVEVKDFKGKYDTHAHNDREYDERLAKFFAENTCIPRHAWWENETPWQEGEHKLQPGEGRPVVEVVVREQKRTGLRFVFVLNKGGAGRGRLCGDDFADVGLKDALTGESVSTTLDMPAFGYRILTAGRKK